MYYTKTQSPFGDIILTASTQGLTGLYFTEGNAASVELSTYKENNDHFEQSLTQLREYFSGERKTFDLTLAPKGTNFQQQVWQTLCSIPCGETKSYRWLAEQIKNPNAVRAVGGANGKNPIALIIPCHRVIGSNGSLTGYAGGLSLKEKLLKFEGAI
ncbi:methylated-DNA--[protein]-cysteine S-methyltransferase [Thalassotalea sp. 1_MG-2023]|uniref:methylated-DNA--[protein]-cysteine S-methyltransferase n=1 Tax=Thalassotalea sp. 1_MG-2023 TaxID=3062680 RepID=UPI0026E284C0|nr:methylated-DNA--[protein]-cysteine S-methyltransferase [Thalassotalea sp. 1_MG-2023]MDO6428350.1 methylated-DNA--[protein]-cysteine S-methyltransferase [Thalassotalea sp. 1_MG-2023]